MTKAIYQFLIVPAEPPHPDAVDVLMGACDDVTVEVSRERCWVAFDRVAPSLVDAIVSGVRDVAAAGISPVRVRLDDDLVTLDVVAQRVGAAGPGGCSGPEGAGGSGKPENVLNWAARQDFPAPVDPHPQRALYSWRAVAGWIGVHFGQTWPDAVLTMRAVDLALELRTLMPRIERGSGIRAVLWS